MTTMPALSAGDAAWAGAEARRIAREYHERQAAQRRRETPPAEPPPPTVQPLTEGENAVPSIPTPQPQPSTWRDLAATIGPIVWDWERWLARGFLHLLVGESGCGKSQLALRLAGCYLAGWLWPDGSTFTGEKGQVLWCECEGAQALNLQRAGKWGLDIDNLLSPFSDPLQDALFDNPQHRRAIEQAARLPEVRLVVVDSLSGISGARRDENSTAMLGIVKGFAQLARDSGKPVVLTHHLRKKGLLDGDDVSLSRVRGSSAIVQCTRLVWALDTPKRDDPEALRLSVVKSNLDRFPSPVGLSIAENGITFGPAPEKHHEPSEAEKALDFLQCELAGGPVKRTQIDEDARLAGVSLRAVKRVKDELEIRTYRAMDCWWWALPATE